jgi:hypothetical protein
MATGTALSRRGEERLESPERVLQGLAHELAE